MKTINDMKEKGGRAYALAAYGIRWVGILTAVYAALLVGSVVFGVVTLTAELLTPLTVGVLTIGAMAGAQVAPNIAERWAGKETK